VEIGGEEEPFELAFRRLPSHRWTGHVRAALICLDRKAFAAVRPP